MPARGFGGGRSAETEQMPCAALTETLPQEVIMGVSGIGSLLGTGSTDAVYKVGLGANTIRSRSDDSDSGDTVDISDEAKKLFSE